MGAWKHEETRMGSDEDRLRARVRELEAELQKFRERDLRTTTPTAHGPIIVQRGAEGEPVILAGKRRAEILHAFLGPDAQIEVVDLLADQWVLLRIGDLIGGVP